MLFVYFPISLFRFIYEKKIECLTERVRDFLLPVIRWALGITTEAPALDTDMGDWEAFLHFLYFSVYYCKC